VREPTTPMFVAGPGADSAQQVGEHKWRAQQRLLGANAYEEIEQRKWKQKILK
jgi:hypothetical protein